MTEKRNGSEKMQYSRYIDVIVPRDNQYFISHAQSLIQPEYLKDSTRFDLSLPTTQLFAVGVRHYLNSLYLPDIIDSFEEKMNQFKIAAATYYSDFNFESIYVSDEESLSRLRIFSQAIARPPMLVESAILDETIQEAKALYGFESKSHHVQNGLLLKEDVTNGFQGLTAWLSSGNSRRDSQVPEAS